MKKTKILKIALAPIISLAVLFGFLTFTGDIIQAQSSCPSNTTVQEKSATLVGEVTDDGGDPDMRVWFKYGSSSSNLNYSTATWDKYGVGLFCREITGLTPCKTYYYQALSSNSAGNSYGEIKSFKTLCSPVSVDLKVNNSNGPVTARYNDTVTVSWTSDNAVSCSASGDWSGSKSTSGSQSIKMEQAKTYTFNITCTGQDGDSKNDSVQVKVSVNPPVVITRPAVVTY
jgi:hypothetical protein